MLAVRYDLDRARAAVTKDALRSRPPGMYRFRELLPLEDGEEPVTLGEGGTPLLPLPRLAAHVGLRHVLAKDEVNHVGEAVVMVVATNRYVAEDACQRIRVTYEQLPVVVRWIAYASPLWHGVELCRAATLDTGTALGWSGHVACLTAWAVAGYLLACRQYARKLTD